MKKPLPRVTITRSFVANCFVVGLYATHRTRVEVAWATTTHKQALSTAHIWSKATGWPIVDETKGKK